MEKFTNLILILAAAVLALASCNKMPVAGMHSFLPNEIYFSDGGITIDTKAFAEATNKSLQDNGFNVAALIDNGNTIMFNKTVTYNSGAFSVSGERYFFPTEGTMSFYAVYPKTQTITVKSGAATLSYSQNADTDLIAARKTAVSGSSAPVTLAFDHLLSQVSISATGTERMVDYKVRSVKITGAGSGTYGFATGKWTLGNTTAGIPIYDKSDAVEISTTDKTPIGSPVSVIPGTVKLNVVWDCYNKGTSTVVCSKDVTVDVTLPQGKHTTLYLTLPFNSSEITFNTSVGAWVTGSENIEMKYEPKLVDGVFTVNNSGKKVKFTKGNLYWSGSEFRCEETQYSYPATWITSHIGHFYWSRDARVAYAINQGEAGIEFDIALDASDKFFAADGGAIAGYTVLDKDEWQYLITHSIEGGSSARKITIASKECIILKPDGFSGTVADSYTAAEWATAEIKGLVALPIAGLRDGTNINMAGSEGFYWSSSLPTGYMAMYTAYYICFDSGNAEIIDNNRNSGSSIRLVQVQ